MNDSNNELDWVERLVQTFKENELFKLEFETEDVSLTLRKAATKPKPQVLQTLKDDSAAPEMEEADVTLILSKDVGLFRPGRGLEAGATISIDQKIGTIEAVSVEHDLISEHHGILVELLVQDGDPVEYGQPLLVLSESKG